jgi:hypothetical protein
MHLELMMLPQRAQGPNCFTGADVCYKLLSLIGGLGGSGATSSEAEINSP